MDIPRRRARAKFPHRRIRARTACGSRSNPPRAASSRAGAPSLPEKRTRDRAGISRLGRRRFHGISASLPRRRRDPTSTEYPRRCLEACGNCAPAAACADDPSWHKAGSPAKRCVWASRFSNRLAALGEDGRYGAERRGNRPRADPRPDVARATRRLRAEPASPQATRRARPLRGPVARTCPAATRRRGARTKIRASLATGSRSFQRPVASSRTRRRCSLRRRARRPAGRAARASTSRAGTRWRLGG